MDEAAAKDLIEETFNNPYDPSRFRWFLKNLTKDYEERHKTAIVPASFQDAIQSLYRFGKIIDAHQNEIDLLAVHLKKETSLDRARTLQRNFIARYLSRRNKDAALVAFVAPESGSWRFSLVCREIGLTQTLEGKTKAVQEFSPARRFSFLVGLDEKTHTPKRQLLPLLKNDQAPTLKTLESAFSIETVTEEFFREYKELFSRLTEAIDGYLQKHERVQRHFGDKEIEPSDFAKRLLGQIVFLYFLQRKGWLGVPKGKNWGEGSSSFLRDLYKKAEAEKANFFNKYLEPLFYDALNRNNSENDHYYEKFECRIPFLNGGLFEPYQGYDWIETDIDLDNSLFSNSGHSLFGDDGNGILDIFDRYNFTVAEDEPLEREVAIDPEMLGKVFENLLEIRDRKEKGTYYTPRTIVHFMCQESLIAYLANRFDAIPQQDLEDLIRYGDLLLEHDGKILRDGPTDTYKDFFLAECVRQRAREIDEALVSVKVCDPAIGSGAFPVGMMTEIVRARRVLAMHMGKPVKPYDLKHHTIHESLYGVDVDNGAIEIAKLRLWLSLIVDEDEFREVHALPNLDYKIMQGNALLQSYAGIKLFEDRLVTAHDNLIRRQRQLEEELQDLQSRLMNFLTNSETAANPGEKRNLEKAIKEKSRELQKLKQQPKTEDDLPLLAGQSSASALAEELERLHEEIFQETTQGRKNELRTKIAVLEWELIKASLKEQGREDEIPVVSRLQEANNKPYFLWKLHFSNVFFSDNGGGFDIVIANPPYVRHEEIKELKPALKSEFGDFFKGTADLYTYFYKRGIDLLAPHGHLCFIAPNKFFRAGYGSRLQQTLKNEVSLKEIIDFRDLPIFDSTTYPAVILLEKAQPSEENTFQAAVFTEESQLEDVSLSFPKAAFSMQRSDLDDGGWLLAPTDVTALRRKLRNAGTPLGEYVNGRFYYGIKTGLNDAFVIDGTTRERLISEDPKCAEIIKPWLRGKDIKRWHARWSGLYVIFTRRGVDINRYPSVKGHLEKYRHELEPKKNSSQKKGRKPGSYKWFEIQDNIAYHEEFECPKIVWGNLAKFPKFSYDSGSYVSAPANIIPTADTFLLAILNSPVCEWLISLNAAERFGGYLEFKPMYVGQVPVPHCSEADRERLSAWVQAILKAKRGDSEADVSELESKINEEVYKFYDLTADEIALIEEATTQVNVHGDAVGKTFALQGPS